MAEDEGVDEYELVPRNKIQDLQKQIETLKKSPLAAAPSGGELAQAMDKLSSHMENLLSLFKEASEEMRKEERESESVVKKMDPLMEKLDMVVDQNKKIAKAILTVADMVRELQEKQASRPVMPMPPGPLPPMGRPMMGAPMPPPPMGLEEVPLPEPAGMGLPPLTPSPMGQGPSEIPPPPGPPGGMGAPKKRGLFG